MEPVYSEAGREFNGGNFCGRQLLNEKAVMLKNWNQIQQRLMQKDAEGHYLTAAKGDEPLEELREIAEQIIYFCPAAHAAVGCPFDRLSKLTDQSMHAALTHLSREDLLDLFAMERECRTRVLEK